MALPFPINKNLQAAVVHLEKELTDGIADGLYDCAKDQTSLRHFFVEPVEEFGCGLYTRELTVPAGLTFTGALHRHAHMVFLLKGELLVISESGKKHIKAPHTWSAPAGTKRAFLALEDSILTNVHLTKKCGIENLQEIEDAIISPSYKELGLAEPDLKT